MVLGLTLPLESELPWQAVPVRGAEMRGEMSRMRRIFMQAACLVAFGGALMAQPSIRAELGVINAASGAATLAPGVVFTVYGAGLGPAAIVVDPAAPWETALSGTSVRFTPVSGGTALDARIYYTLAGQVAGLLPSTAAPGDYNVTVTYNNQTSAPRRVTVAARALGLISVVGNGAGPAVSTDAEYRLIRFTTGTLGQFTLRPANPGDALVLWATGLGADAASDAGGNGSGDQRSQVQVRVIVAGREVDPIYAGRSPGSPGLDQINFSLPGDLAPNCFVPVQVRVGTTLSNLLSLPVAPRGQNFCTDPALNEAALRRLAQGGELVMGLFNLSSIETSISVPILGSITSKTESVSGNFSRYRADQAADSNISLFSNLDGCFVLRRRGEADQLALGVAPTPLDAGTPLRLNGPNASNIAVDRSSDLTYDKTLANIGSPIPIPGVPNTPVIAAGTYRLTGTGGPAIGAFEASLTVAPVFNWTNKASYTGNVSRSTPLNITWSGGGNDLVVIGGVSGVRDGGTTDNPIYSAAIFSCVTRASRGSFAVPVSILQQLPANTGSIIDGSGIGFLNVFSSTVETNGRFTAPLTAGGNIDFGLFNATIGFFNSVTWQ
ncbi:MAG TPA: hypothetical protein DEH78_04930 [Solibacterales bacterium]|nr:hypothetical protein [Bryobacterales bacterium]